MKRPNRRAALLCLLATALAGTALAIPVNPASAVPQSCPLNTPAYTKISDVTIDGVKYLLCEANFTTSTSWTPPAAIRTVNGVSTVDAVVVGGGGGGAGGNWPANYSAYWGNGGGGGHVTYVNDFAVSGTQTVTIGARGSAASPSNTSNGGDGGQSAFGSLTAAGGTGGTLGYWRSDLVPSGGFSPTRTFGGTSGRTINGTSNATNGGSDSAPTNTANNVAAGLTTTSNAHSGGGGAGAGGDGMDGGASGATSPWSPGTAGAGGPGYTPNTGLFAGASTAYGAGGSGAAGSNGGPSSGSSNGGTSGTANTGNGGSGFKGTSGSSYGGTGVVLIRFYVRVASSPAVVISTEPTSTTVASGDPATFSVAVTNSNYISYQWEEKPLNGSWTAVSGATSASYSLPQASVANNGTMYRAVVTRSTPDLNTSSATSAEVTLTVTGGDSGGGSNINGGGGSDSGGESNTNGGGGSNDGGATTDPLGPITPATNSNLKPGGLGEGEVLLLVNGVPMPAKTKPKPKKNPVELIVTAADLSMGLEGRGDEEDPLGLSPKQALNLQSGKKTRAKDRVKVQPTALSQGAGFKPNSEVKFYILPDIYVGTLMTDASGAYSGTLNIPPGIAPGVHTMQANGYAPSGEVRSMNLGVRVKARSSNNDQRKHVSFRLQFGNTKAKLMRASKLRLQEAVARTGTDVTKVVVHGYVQQYGSDANDAALSKARARNVAAFLRSIGVNGRFTAKGAGVAGSKINARKAVVSITFRD